MKASNIIQELINKYQTSKKENEKYKIQDLYIGQIVTYDKNPSLNYIQQRLSFKEIKPLAIFYKIDENTYIHIQTGQELMSWDSVDIKGDYSIRHIVSFSNFYAIARKSFALNEKSKLTKKEIKNLEYYTNRKFAEKQSLDILDL